MAARSAGARSAEKTYSPSGSGHWRSLTGWPVASVEGEDTEAGSDRPASTTSTVTGSHLSFLLDDFALDLD
jgi:hypothetical protein